MVINDMGKLWDTQFNSAKEAMSFYSLLKIMKSKFEQTFLDNTKKVGSRCP